MLVCNWMSPRLITITPDEPMLAALSLMKKHRITFLPVVDAKGRLQGVVTDRDLKRANASDATLLSKQELNYLLMKLTIKEIMTKKPYSIHKHGTIEEAAQNMCEHGFSGLPVVDTNGQTVSVITKNDVFRALVLLSGVTQGDMQICMDIPERRGYIELVKGIIKQHGGHVISTLSVISPSDPTDRRVFIRIRGLDLHGIKYFNKQLARFGRLRYLVYSRDGRKELYQPKPKWEQNAA
jgi:acetoin utilization protein AcuB